MTFTTVRGFVNELVIDAPPATVLAVVADPVAFAHLNPLVVKVEIDEQQPGYYTVTDRLGSGRFSFTVRYRAWMMIVEDGIDSAAWSFPRVHLRSKWRFLPHVDGTLARETVDITMLSPVAAYVLRSARSAHQELLRRLKAHVER